MAELNKDKVRGNYIMDCLDIAEKALQKKAAAKADTEQPGKEVRHGKWWYGPNYVKAKLKIKLSGKASVLADYIYSHYIEGQNWDFQNWHAEEETGLKLGRIQSAKAELIDKNVVKRVVVTNDKMQFESWRYPFNPDFETWTTGTGKPINGKTINGKTINGKSVKGKTIKGKTGNINIEEDKVLSKSSYDKDLNMEEREWAAAKPQPAPPPGTASKGSSFPETAQGQQNGNKYQIPLTVPEVMKQGQTDLFGEPERERVPEKPKGKGKKFIPPTLDEVVADIGRQLAREGKLAMWTSDQIRDFAESFITHYTIDPDHQWENNKGKKIVSWRGTLATWLKNVDYLPPVKTNRNQPGRARGQVTTAARIMEMAGNTDPQRALEQRREQEIQKGGVIIQD